MSRLRAPAREHAGNAASLAVLLIAAKAIFGRVGAFDLGFDDECRILDRGLKLPAWPLPPPDYGPLYAVRYRVLGALEPDPVRLYTFNWVVLQLALAALLYALSRRSGAPRLAAALVTIAWSLSRAVTLWPFAVYFSTALRALGLRGERVVLDAEFSRAVYARIPFRWVPINDKDRPFSQFLQEHDVDVVIVTQRLRNDARFRDDPEFRSFLADGGDRRGFVLAHVPRAATIIAYRPK